MQVWRLLVGFNARQLWQLLLVLFQNPLCILPTVIATQKTIGICDRLYKEAHHADGVANAFRHVLWNVLIGRYVYRWVGDAQKALDWAKVITDLHEELSPNVALEKAMDLHNNAVGRCFFKEVSEVSEEAMIAFLEEKTKQAVAIKEVRELSMVSHTMAYIVS